MNFMRTRNDSTRNSTNIMLPRLSVNASTLPVNLQRTGSLNNIILPKLSSRNEIMTLSPVLSNPSIISPRYLQKTLSNVVSSPLLKSPLLPNLSSSVKSNKTHGVVHLYCANTHKGIVRDYNEDRVMIMLRIPKPTDRKEEKWPACSFFGLYDGHGGKNCSNFLRDNLHTFITQDPNFPSDPQASIIRGFAKAESSFLDLAYKKKDKSGSCAIVVLIVGKKAFVANLGDSRAVLSINNGKEIVPLTTDHKPSEENENQRIVNAGGEVYVSGQNFENSISRILPGRLSVSRAFGDIEAKLKEIGGNPNVLIAVPEVRVFNLPKSSDFIIMGCDGIFDRLSNEDVVNILNRHDESRLDEDPLKRFTSGVENIVIEAMQRESFDNVTVLAIGFENFLKNSLTKTD